MLDGVLAREGEHYIADGESCKARANFCHIPNRVVLLPTDEYVVLLAQHGISMREAVEAQRAAVTRHKNSKHLCTLKVSHAGCCRDEIGGRFTEPRRTSAHRKPEITMVPGQRVAAETQVRPSC